MNKQVIDEAAEWFIEINEDTPDRATRQRFHAWLTRSPEHVHAYLKILPIWQAGRKLDTYQNDPEALIAWAEKESNVLPLTTPVCVVVEAPVRKSRLTATVTAFAASAVLAATILYVGFQASSGIYKTDVGEHVVITLTDQSTVELNSRSKMKVRFNERERSIELLEGQALFKVAREVARPFVVRSGDTSVLAVGTQFDVYRKKSGTVVTVVEGRVAVTDGRMTASSDAIPLSAGEQVTVTSAALSQPKPANVAIATAWTQQQLVFFRTPLPEVVEEFNRYNKRRLVVTEDDRLKAYRISGTFSSTDPASLIHFLQAQRWMRVDESRGSVVVSRVP